MSREMIAGLLVGVLYAFLDALLLHVVTKQAVKHKKRASSIISAGFLVRYLLTGAVLASALFISALDAVGVVLPLILQKAALVLLALIPKKK